MGEAANRIKKFLAQVTEETELKFRNHCNLSEERYQRLKQELQTHIDRRDLECHYDFADVTVFDAKELNDAFHILNLPPSDFCYTSTTWRTSSKYMLQWLKPWSTLWISYELVYFCFIIIFSTSLFLFHYYFLNNLLMKKRYQKVFRLYLFEIVCSFLTKQIFK